MSLFILMRNIIIPDMIPIIFILWFSLSFYLLDGDDDVDYFYHHSRNCLL